MGDIIKAFSVRSSAGERSRRLRLYFDTGSSWTLVKESAARGFRAAGILPKPRAFSGPGNGAFAARRFAQLEVRLLNIWCPHLCYIVADKVLEEDYDILLGHDFMQRYDIRLRPQRREVVIRKSALLMALRVRSC